jgi:hypothetical protein
MDSRATMMKMGDFYLKALDEDRLIEREDIVEALANKWFRLNALYFIKDKAGNKVPFMANRAQRRRFKYRHCRDLILKARQLGFTTLEMLDALDDCLFTDNFNSGVIAHKLDDAQDIFRNKVLFAYNNISAAWRGVFAEIGLTLPVPKSETTGRLVLSNGSSINVSTSYRGGTLQRLHVSEFGKICRQYPEKAREIVTGAFEAVGIGNQITLESTAEGQEGYFYDYSMAAQRLEEQDKAPTAMDFKHHFFPWWEDPEYRMDPEGVIIPSRLLDYFEQLEVKEGVPTDAGQQAWYAKKEAVLQDDMKREYPSTAAEAFEQSIEGAYYARQMTDMRKEGRLTSHVQHNPALPVYTAWDLGMNDAMCIWFVQVVGREVHVINYMEESGEEFEFYAEKFRELEREESYHFVPGGHFGPHDLAVRELGSGRRLDSARALGISFADPIPRVSNQMEGVAAVRRFLPVCWIDEEACHDGVMALDSYRKEWDDRLGRFKDTPRHDWASHGSKAFETLARSGIIEVASRGSVFGGPPRGKKVAGKKWAAHT